MQPGDSGSLQDQLAAKFGEGLASSTTDNTDTPTTTAGRLAKLIEKVSGIDAQTVTEDKRLEDLGVDSLDRIEIAVRAEEEFGKRIDDEDVAGLVTVADAVTFLEPESGSDSAGS